jgi:hypothetical protein
MVRLIGTFLQNFVENAPRKRIILHTTGAKLKHGNDYA